MMKFFKYIILFIFSLISFNSFGAYVAGPNTGVKSYAGATAVDACRAYASALGKTYGWTDSGACIDSQGSYFGSYELDTKTCPVDTEKFLDGYITAPDSSPPSIVCFSGCTYDSQGVWIGMDETANGNMSWGTTAKSTGAKCYSDTPKGSDTPVVKKEECRNIDGSDSYCNKPTGKACPTGYKSGSFNNKEICIKDSEKPTNPNDPNNESSNDKFDDTRIVDAINTSKKATVDAINNALNSIKSSITESTNNITNSINSIGSSISNAVNGIGASINATLNANGDKVTTAVNKGTDATKDNGNKIDGVKDGVEEGNGILKGISKTLDDIKDWLTEEPTEPESQKPTIEEHQIDNYEQSYVQWSASCPPDVQVPISLMGQSSTLVLKWQPWCTLLAKIKWAIIACAYFSAAYIILGMR